MSYKILCIFVAYNIRRILSKLNLPFQNVKRGPCFIITFPIISLFTKWMNFGCMCCTYVQAISFSAPDDGSFCRITVPIPDIPGILH